ncbi:MAG: adenylate/guanylate cyclase domain-containing protein, partial [Desulfobacterales bacterium]|nr:adenylate/guanylate cyclase domain-containing protein [Desulfobacterales bacterium]
PAGLMDNDQVLADVLRNGSYSLGFFFNFEQQQGSPENSGLHPLNPIFIKEAGAGDPAGYLLQARAAVVPLKELAAAAGYSGFLNALPDEDGIIRKTPLLISWNGKIYPSLALSALQATFKEKLPVSLKLTSGGIESMRIGTTVVPLDRNGRMLLHYRGPHKTFTYYSAGQVLEDRLPKGALAGKIVIVGTSAAGLKDIRATPFDSVYPGMEVHATAIDNILAGDFLARPDWAPGFELCLIVFFGFVTTVLITWTGGKWTLPVVVCAGVLMWQGGIWYLGSRRMFFSPLFPMISLAVNFPLLTLLKFWHAEKEKGFLRQAFSRYVSDAVVEQMTNSPEKLSLAGEQKELSIIFSDIRGFTTISEKLSPAQIVELLHDYFTPMTRVITNNYGTLDKFIGDAIMAFWNAPIDIPDHKIKALRSVVEMVAALDDLNKVFAKKYGLTIDIGIGLHAGIVQVGNIGTDDLFDYTIIGDDVNITSRLEGLTKFYGVKCIVSETMKSVCPGGILLQDLDLVRVKGRTEPIRIFGLYSPKRHHKNPEQELAQYHEALGLYRHKRFKTAMKLFAALQEDYFNRKLYLIYQQRCAAFVEQPPPDDWDGVYIHTTK